MRDTPCWQHSGTSSNPARRGEFERILRLLASAFPLEALHVDVSANPEEVSSLRIDPEDLRMIVSSMWHILRSRGQSPTEIKGMDAVSRALRSTVGGHFQCDSRHL